MSVDGKRAITRILEYGPRTVRISGMSSQEFKALVYAYAPETYLGYRTLTDLWRGARVKHRASAEPGMIPPAGMPVFFADSTASDLVVVVVGVSIGEGSFGFWHPTHARIISMGIDQYLTEHPEMRLLGWTEDVFSHVVMVGDRCATCGDTEHTTAEHADPIDAIPQDIDRNAELFLHDDEREDTDELDSDTIADETDTEEPESETQGLYIEGTIRLADGSVRTFSISDDGTWQQWGATTENLGKTVDVVQTMATALAEEGLL